MRKVLRLLLKVSMHQYPKIRFKRNEGFKLLQSGMTVEEENELEYLFYPRTSQEAIEYLAKVREEIDFFEFRPGTMDDAFIALTGRGSLMLALLKRIFILYFVIVREYFLIIRGH